MNHSRLLHETLESVNWDYVVQSFRGLGLQWYGSDKIPKKKELVFDLTEIIEFAFDNVDEEGDTQVVTPYWIVCIEKDENTDEILLEVIFTPFTLFTSSISNTNKTITINSEKLKQRLRMALEKESYELAGLIQETLDNYNKPTDQTNA